MGKDKCVYKKKPILHKLSCKEDRCNKKPCLTVVRKGKEYCDYDDNCSESYSDSCSSSSSSSNLCSYALRKGSTLESRSSNVLSVI